MKITPISKTIHKIDLPSHFDAQFASEFDKALDALTNNHKSYAIVDLAEVTFIDSAGLGALVRGMKHYLQNDGDLYLVNLQTPVRLLFEYTRMERAFKIFPTAADALADIHAENE